MLGERGLEVVIYLCGISAIVFVLGIFFFVFKEAFPILGNPHFSLREFLFSEQWYPTSEVHKRYGVLAMIVGTLSVTGLAMLIAVPFGLGAAIYLSEFCGGRVKETLKVVIELLAAIPSVVWGFIGLTVLSRLIVKYTGAPVGVNVLNGGIILALMCLPIIVSIGRRRTQGRAGFVPGGGFGPGGDALATHLACAAAGGEDGIAGRGVARRRARGGGDDGGADGYGSCRAYSA